MKRYDPNRAPHPEKRLGLDEQERIILVERFHRRVGEKVPSSKMHAVVHAAVETQLALNEPALVREAFARLMGEGLDRHEAIHAIGSVLAEYLFDALKGNRPRPDLNEAYTQAVSKLTAASWRAV